MKTWEAVTPTKTAEKCFIMFQASRVQCEKVAVKNMSVRYVRKKQNKNKTSENPHRPKY